MDRIQKLVRNDPSLLIQQLCLDRGIALRLSPPGLQEMDDVAEKSGGRDIYEHGTALLRHSGLALGFWPFASTTSRRFIATTTFGSTSQRPRLRLPRLRPPGQGRWWRNLAFSSRVERCIHLGIARESA